LVLLKRYGVKVINGRSRTPSTQGLIEQANGTVMTPLQAWKDDIGSTEWAAALSDIVLKMNRAVHGAIATSPYEVIFDRKPRWNQHLAPHERVEATLGQIPEESTNEQSLLHFDVDDQHNFTTSYTFDSDKDEQASDSAVNIPNASKITDTGKNDLTRRETHSAVNRPVRPGSLRTGTDGKVAVRPRAGPKRRRLFEAGQGRTAMTAK